MTKNLTVSRIKPNPSGKDRNRYGDATAAQLGAEWVDIENTSRDPVNLQGVELYHLAFTGLQGSPAKVMGFTGSLAAGQTVRVHSGRVRDLAVLRKEDLDGAEHHVFTGRDMFVWNNSEGDTPSLWAVGNRTWIDRASYDRNPPEGAVLVRIGDKLVPAQRAASGW